jgi:predicted RNA-binding Zn ribbon-like protein
VEFNSHTDRVIQVAVDLVNLLSPGDAKGHPYDPPADASLAAPVSAVLRVGGESRDVTADEVAELRTYAAVFRDVFTVIDAGDIDAAATRVNELLRWTGARPELARHGGYNWHLHYHPASESIASGWAAGCAAGLATVVGGPFYDRLGVCTAPRCDRVYVDVSRNGQRRFCSATCQNRVKAAAFRARQAEIHSP